MTEFFKYALYVSYLINFVNYVINLIDKCTRKESQSIATGAG